MIHQIHGPSPPRRERIGGLSDSTGSTQGVNLPWEALKLIAVLQVKVDVLRRAQTMGPQFADELQVEIDEIERQLSNAD